MKKNRIRGSSIKSGLPPATTVFVGEKVLERVIITALDYNASIFKWRTIINASDITNEIQISDSHTTWVDIEGVHDIEALEALGKVFSLHPLVVEDLANTQQRPKIEEFDNYIFIVLKSLSWNIHSAKENHEQISIILGKNFVLTIREGKTPDLFRGLRERIRVAKGKISVLGADYLVYALMDMIVDEYFVALEKIGELVETLETEIIIKPTPHTLRRINHSKRDMISLRKAIWPVREIVAFLERSESWLLNPEMKPYLRDLYDHSIQIIDAVETLRDTFSSMADMYLSSVNNRLNEIVKTLTIFSTIFMPLTFIVGVYGMNFHNFPELEWKYGYAYVWTLMISISCVLLMFFKKRKWL